MKTKLMIPVFIVAMSMITACSGVMDSAQPARQNYMLMPLPGSSAAILDETAPILSLSLVAVPGLDSDWVQALGTDAALTRYANARWTDSLPEVLTSVIQRSLVSTGQFAAVQQSTHASAGGWKLKLEVQKFYGMRNADGDTSRVVVEISGSITCADKRQAFALSDSVTVGGQRLSTVVAAHQQGLNSVTQQLITTIDQACQ
jgi:ABC-type uncharacterized transport system auxiliary subunit